MKAVLYIALIACVAFAHIVDAGHFIPLQKKPKPALSPEYAALVASGNPVPLKGNIPNYGEYVTVRMSHVYFF